MGFYSFIPYYAVVKFGLTPYESAAVLTPRALIVIAVSTVASLAIKRLGYRLPMLLGMVFVGVNFVLMAQGWTSVPLGFGLSLSGFWLLAVLISIGGIGMGISNPASNNAAIDLAPDKAAAITGIRGTFRLAGGTISISCIVLTLSFFSDQAAGLDMVFLVFTGVLLLSVPLALMIPEPLRKGAASALPEPVPFPRDRVSAPARESSAAPGFLTLTRSGIVGGRGVWHLSRVRTPFRRL